MKNMKVKELIEELQKFDGDSRVWIWKRRDASETERVTKVREGYVTKYDDVIIS